MNYDCVCLLLIMATTGSCNDDKILAITLYAAGIQPPPPTPSKRGKTAILIINKLQVKLTALAAVSCTCYSVKSLVHILLFHLKSTNRGG